MIEELLCLGYTPGMKNLLQYILTSVVIFTSFAAWAQTPQTCTNRATIEKFFANYALIGNWNGFITEQSKVLAPNLITVASDHRGVKNYSGPAGYFASLGDWSQVFATGPDFHLDIVSVTPSRVVVRLHGKLTLKTPIQGYGELTDSQHHWTEVFTLKDPCKIQKLDVLMNLFK